MLFNNYYGSFMNFNIKKFIVILHLVLLSNIFVQLPSLAIKIGLIENSNNIFVGSSKNSYLINGQTGGKLKVLNAMTAYKIGIYRDSLSIEIDKTNYNTHTSFLIIKLAEPGFVCAKRKWYRGDLLILKKGNSITVINDIPLEDYLKGVVPSEMPAKWNIEAHKAQAIAARSYAIANLGKRSSKGYDLKDTPEDQAYGGASSETVQTNAAVNQTSGIVITYDKRVIPAYYCASAGGKTLGSGQVWVQDLPYLKSVPSFDKNVSKNGHGVGMSQHGANNLANKGYNAFQILNYFYQNTKFGKLDSSWHI